MLMVVLGKNIETVASRMIGYHTQNERKEKQSNKNKNLFSI